MYRNALVEKRHGDIFVKGNDPWQKIKYFLAFDPRSSEVLEMFYDAA